jgi:hypothetical protein
MPVFFQYVSSNGYLCAVAVPEVLLLSCIVADTTTFEVCFVADTITFEGCLIL